MAVPMESFKGVIFYPGISGTAAMTTNILALEVRPGTLLKLTSDSSPDKFLSAAQRGDASGTCGHLVSIMAANKGVDGTPMALLGNHVKTALYTMQTAPSDDPGKYHSYQMTL